MNFLKTPYKNIFVLGLLVFIITAFYSEGYHHPDEHFQILEFCNYKLGNTPSSELAWEFEAQSRQALPVFVAFAIIKTLSLINIINPFTIAFILRLLVAFAAWIVIRKLCLILLENFKTEKGKKIFVLMSMFLWFVPYINVRFSSENLAGITFLYAIYFILTLSGISSIKKMVSLSIIGFLLGFTFYFRFQMGFAIVGLGLWLLIIYKIRWNYILIIIISGCISIFTCIFIDYWFYGNWLFSPINYFTKQIVQDVASNWGVNPWWYYSYLFILQGIPPLSLLLLIFFFIGLYKNPKSIFVWSIILFIIAHCAVGHKEMRFMYPVVFIFTYLAASGIDYLFFREKFEKIISFLLVLAIIINMPILFLKMVTPAQESVNCFKFLFKYSEAKEIVLFCKDRNIYNLVDLNATFYQSPNVKCIVFKEKQEILNYLNKEKPNAVYLLERNLSIDDIFSGYNSEIIYCLFPKWILYYNINDWERRARIWNIKRIEKIKE